MIETFPFPFEVVRRPYLRLLKVAVKSTGEVVVTAGKTTPMHDIHWFLRNKLTWIEKCQGHFQKLRDRYPRKLYREDELFLWQGEWLRLRIRPEVVSRPQVVVEKPYLLGLIPLRLWEVTTDESLRELLREHVRAFYEREGRRLLAERVEHFQHQMQLHPRSVSFRCQKTRWGSCTHSGKISLNWRLIVAPPEVLDYVVVHELAHLREHNHSPRFWNLVAKQMPDFTKHRLWLKQHMYEADFLALKSDLHG